MEYQPEVFNAWPLQIINRLAKCILIIDIAKRFFSVLKNMFYEFIEVKEVPLNQ